MKNLFVSFCLFFVLPCSAIQYSFIRELNERALKLLPAQNGNFYSISTQLNCPDDYVIVRYCNAQGDVQATFTSPALIGHITSLDAVVNSLNNIVVYVRMDHINHHLFELNSSGTLIRNNNIQFTNPVVKFEKLVLSPSGYYLVGNTPRSTWSDSAHAVITKLNTNCKVAWNKAYRIAGTMSASTNFLDALYENDQLLCVGHYYFNALYAGQAPFRPLICRMDSSGNPLLSYAYTVDSSFVGFDEYEIVQVEKTPHGSYYMLGFNFGNEHALFKFRNNLDVQWIREGLSGKAWAMCAGFKEDVFIVPDYPHENFIQQLDSNGQALSNHITKYVAGHDLSFGQIGCIEKDACGFLVSNDETMYAHTNQDMQYCLDSTHASPGNYYAVNNVARRNIGLQTLPISSFNEYLMTTPFTPGNTSATTLCSTTYTCGSPLFTEQADIEGPLIYPNPANDFLQIRLPAMCNDATVALFTMQGKCLLNTSWTVGGWHGLPVDTYAPGIYSLRIRYGQQVFERRLVIER